MEEKDDGWQSEDTSVIYRKNCLGSRDITDKTSWFLIYNMLVMIPKRIHQFQWMGQI